MSANLLDCVFIWPPRLRAASYRVPSGLTADQIRPFLTPNGGEAVDYFYRVRYAGKTADPSLEKHFLKGIRQYERGAG